MRNLRKEDNRKAAKKNNNKLGTKIQKTEIFNEQIINPTYRVEVVGVLLLWSLVLSKT